MFGRILEVQHQSDMTQTDYSMTVRAAIFIIRFILLMHSQILILFECKFAAFVCRGRSIKCSNCGWKRDILTPLSAEEVCINTLNALVQANPNSPTRLKYSLLTYWWANDLSSWDNAINKATRVETLLVSRNLEEATYRVINGIRIDQVCQ